MEIKQHVTEVFGTECKLELMHFNRGDGAEWKRIFDLWKKLKLDLRGYKSREPNMPEGLSEVAFCLWSGAGRFISVRSKNKVKIPRSFDTFDINSGCAQQIKACSIERDLTTFGPKSRWDELYFLDFYNNGEVDGYFDIYKIPDEYIHNQSVNKKENFKDQQSQKRRPRFSIKKEIILKYGIKPLASHVKVW